MEPIIYGRLLNVALGDTWAFISYVIYECRDKGRKVCFFSRLTQSQKVLFKDIFDLLQTNVKMRLTNETPNQNVRGGVQEFSFGTYAFDKKYVPTKRRWTKNNGRLIAYQFESVKSRPHQPARFLSEIDEVDFELWKSKSRYTFVDLNNRFSVHQIVDILSQCHCFIGIDSGISHIAHSVGVPRFIKFWKCKGKEHLDWLEPEKEYDVRYFHPNKEYKTFHTIKELIGRIENET